MNTLPAPGFDAFLAFAHTLADRAAEAILPHFRQTDDVEDKSTTGLFDPVTLADRAAEQVIRKLVADTWPEHALLGEEFGVQSGSGEGAAEFCWIVDPIDGTRSFISGMPVWGSLIGLNRQGKPILGLMNQPFTGERYWSTEDHACYRGPDGERQLKTRVCPTLSAATLLSTSPEMFSGTGELARFEALSENVRLRRFGTDCYGYCMVAAGHADLVVESSLQAYDIAPLIPIVERAGGRVTTWDGAPAWNGGRIVASGDPALHDAALSALSA